MKVMFDECIIQQLKQIKDNFVSTERDGFAKECEEGRAVIKGFQTLQINYPCLNVKSLQILLSIVQNPRAKIEFLVLLLPLLHIEIRIEPIVCNNIVQSTRGLWNQLEIFKLMSPYFNYTFIKEYKVPGEDYLRTCKNWGEHETMLKKETSEIENFLIQQSKNRQHCLYRLQDMNNNNNFIESLCSKFIKL